MLHLQSQAVLGFVQSSYFHLSLPLLTVITPCQEERSILCVPMDKETSLVMGQLHSFHQTKDKSVKAWKITKIVPEPGRNKVAAQTNFWQKKSRYPWGDSVG
uniref:Uncharacterized protein n=1 Tax=Micrurus spixii TaxID=129469 RepID=A0A2D4N3I1_9SAUR